MVQGVPRRTKYSAVKTAVPAQRTLAQLRLGQSPLLQAYLHSIGKAPDPYCKACGKVETARHYLLECPEWAQMRLELLGPDPQPGTLRAAQTAVLEFVTRTGRLGGHHPVADTPG